MNLIFLPDLLSSLMLGRFEGENLSFSNYFPFNSASISLNDNYSFSLFKLLIYAFRTSISLFKLMIYVLNPSISFMALVITVYFSGKTILVILSSSKSLE